MLYNYTEKEINIFNGVKALSKSGKKIYNITVQEIAKAAGVGKGTLYEYFSSKEDIIINALMYFLACENLKAEEIAAADICFKDKIYSLYDLIIKSFADGFAMVSQLAASDEMLDIPKLISEQREYIEKVMEHRNDIIVKILSDGVKEGAISLDFDREYIEMAILANLSCINQCICTPQNGHDVCQIEQKKDTAYTLLLKSLN